MDSVFDAPALLEEVQNGLHDLRTDTQPMYIYIESSDRGCLICNRSKVDRSKYRPPFYTQWRTCHYDSGENSKSNGRLLPWS